MFSFIRDMFWFIRNILQSLTFRSLRQESRGGPEVCLLI
ncbi:hypothetical protein LINPERHAP1_LOCUS17283 [Linum perenne]